MNEPIVNMKDWVRPGTFSSEKKDELTEELQDKLEVLDDIVNEVSEQIQKVRRNTELSNEGKRKKIQEIVEKALPRIDRLEPSNLENHLNQIREKINEPLPDSQDLAAQMRQREIRDRLHVMDEADRVQLYFKANQNDDLELIQAVENAPAAFPLMPEEEVDRQRNERLSRKFPVETALLEDFKTYDSLLKKSMDYARQRITQL